MSVWAITERELRVASRRPRTFSARVRAGLAAALLSVPAWFASSAVFRGPTGSGTFQFISAVALYYCVFVGAYRAANSISAEKREGTLGLLVLSGLSPFEIVLGKLASVGTRLGYTLLAAVPALAVPMLRGGVTNAQFWLTVVLLINTLFYSCGLGLLASAASRDERRSINLAILLTLMLVVGWPALGALTKAAGGPRALVAATQFGSPFSAWSAPSTWSVAPGKAAGSILAVQAQGWLFLYLASVMLARTWQDKPAGVQRLRWRDRWRQFTLGSPARRQARRRRMLDENPFYWLIARPRFKAFWPWVLLGLLGGTPLVCWLLWGSGDLIQGLTGVLLAILHLVLKMLIASEGVATVAAGRHDGTLEGLLATPLTVAELLRGQRLALQRQFAGPVLAVVVLDGVLAVIGWRLPANSDHAFSVVLVTTALLLVGDAVALVWTAMWAATWNRKTERASGAAVARVVFLPWLILVVAVVVGAVAGIPGPSAGISLSLWLGLCLGADAAWLWWSRKRLLAQFRHRIATQYQATRPA